MKKHVLNNNRFNVNQLIVNIFRSIVNFFIFSSCTATKEKNKAKPLVIPKQGSFAVGGKVITNPGQDGWRVRLEMAKLRRDAVNLFWPEVQIA